MKLTKNFYLFWCIIGTLIPSYFFLNFLIQENFNVPLMLGKWVENGAVAGITADVSISIIIFWIFSYHDSKKHNIKQWWLTIPAVFCVGLSLALPLYLYFRTDKE